MKISSPFFAALSALILLAHLGAIAQAKEAPVSPSNGPSNGLAPEATDLNAKDASFTLEKGMPYLKKPYISVAPKDKNDGIPVGKLGVDGGNKEMILKFANEIAQASKDGRTGKTDSLLISYKGKLVFESYYRRGRIDYPHYQMSITKSYTAFALGCAMQLGHIKMEDLQKPVTSFLKDLAPSKFVSGADQITLDQAMNMGSGVRLAPDKIKMIRKNPAQLKGQGQIQAYLQHSAPIAAAPRKFKYQASDPAMTMQVVEAIVPGTAKDFIQKEFFGKMGITTYGWQSDTSGLPKSAAGSSIRSRDMLKMGMLVLNKGKWNNEQLIPEAFVDRATHPITATYGTNHYGYFWWVNSPEVNGKKYLCKAGRGAGGQFILIFPELELVAVITAHNKGMGNMLKNAPKTIIPAFLK